MTQATSKDLCWVARRKTATAGVRYTVDAYRDGEPLETFELVIEGETDPPVRLVERRIEERLERPLVEAAPLYDIQVETHDHGGPFQLERTTYYFVMERATNDAVAVFTSEADFGTYPDWDSATESGVSFIDVSTDGRHVIVGESGELRKYFVGTSNAESARAVYEPANRWAPK